MKTYIFRDLCRSFALALVLTCGFTACAQGPATFRVTNQCSKEVKTFSVFTPRATPRVMGNTTHSWNPMKRNKSRMGKRRKSLWDWSTNGRRVSRGLIVR